MGAMFMDILPPPGLEDVVLFGVPALATPAGSPNECFLGELPIWHIAQANADLLRENAELRAQMAVMSENAALVQANARLVEQLQALGRKGGRPEFSTGQLKATAHLEIHNDAASTCAASTCGDFSEAGDNDSIADQGRTTAMMRNIPKTYTRAKLLELLDQHGFNGAYDLVYMPVDFQTELNQGYAFINFTASGDFEKFQEHFTGFSEWSVPSDGVCEISWSEAAQGIDENIQRYRDCSVMHESVAGRCKPVLFERGLRIPFPKPTKKIKAPKLKKKHFPTSE